MLAKIQKMGQNKLPMIFMIDFFSSSDDGVSAGPDGSSRLCHAHV
jgi:hypothetical protein